MSDAKQLASQLRKILPDTSIKCVPTKYAGHAEKLACNLARIRSKPLIISSSGDGGYHEVINGVMQIKDNSAICAVLPAGNANDHSRTLQEEPLYQAIKKGKTTRLDLLRITIETSGKKQIRYAHSYAGLGLTPVVATELNRHTLNAFREASLVIKTFFKYRPFKIRRGGKVLKFDSLIFANINQMAKVLTLSEKNKPDDGFFEVISFLHGRKHILAKRLLRAATTGLKKPRREQKYSFEVLKKMPMQMDGEVTKLSANSKVEVASAKRILLTIV